MRSARAGEQERWGDGGPLPEALRFAAPLRGAWLWRAGAVRPLSGDATPTRSVVAQGAHAPRSPRQRFAFCDRTILLGDAMPPACRVCCLELRGEAADAALCLRCR